MSAIGIVRYWPEQNVAEHENLVRFRQACANIGYDLIELTHDGFRLDNGNALRAGDCELVINLHFAAPKCYDAPSLAPLWNPVQFYSAFGLVSSLANQFSHEYYASTGSPGMVRLLEKIRPDYAGPDLRLNHGVPGPMVPAPLRTSFKFFYVGINWERVNGQPGRHDALLRGLDEASALSVYGPEQLANGVVPWEGFAGYSGSLPFDGVSVIDAARAAGVCLVLSSRAHVRDGIMSNRLFEGIAAGCVLVSDHHPFVKDTFGSLAHYIPAGQPVDETVAELLELRDKLEANPEESRARAAECQRIVADEFLLDRQLKVAVTRIREAEDEARQRQAGVDVACAVLPGVLTSPEDLAAWMDSSPGLADFSRVALFTADQDLADHARRLSTSGRTPLIEAVQLEADETALDSGALIARVDEWLSACGSDWVVFATGNELIHRDFVMKTAEVQDPSCLVVHHASVRRAWRRTITDQVAAPILAMPGENEFWSRALSSFVIRREVIADWIEVRAGAFGVLALTMALDAALRDADVPAHAHVNAVPTVVVPRIANSGGEVMGDIWTATSADPLELIFGRRQRPSVLSSAKQADDDATVAAIARAGAQALVTLKSRVRVKESAAPNDIVPTAQDMVVQFESLSPEQRLYLLKMMLDVVPQPIWRRLHLKLFRARRQLIS